MAQEVAGWVRGPPVTCPRVKVPSRFPHFRAVGRASVSPSVERESSPCRWPPWGVRAARAREAAAVGLWPGSRDPRGGSSRPFHVAAPRGRLRLQRAPRTPGDEETPPSAPGPTPAQCGPQVAPRGRGWASLAAPAARPRGGAERGGGRLGRSWARLSGTAAVGRSGRRDPRGCLGRWGRTPAEGGQGPGGRPGIRPPTLERPDPPPPQAPATSQGLPAACVRLRAAAGVRGVRGLCVSARAHPPRETVAAGGSRDVSSWCVRGETCVWRAACKCAGSCWAGGASFVPAPRGGSQAGSCWGR